MKKKYRGTHTSIMEDAKEIGKILIDLPIVKGISPGVIIAKNHLTNSRSIKFLTINEQNSHIIVKISSKLYTQRISIILLKKSDNAVNVLKNSLKNYCKKYNINLN